MVTPVKNEGRLPTQTHAAVLQQVAQVVKHGLLVLTTDAAEVAQEAAAAGHHLGEGNFLWSSTNIIYPREPSLSD